MRRKVRGTAALVISLAHIEYAYSQATVRTSLQYLVQSNMFYSQLILAKKGELGKVWLAAHMAKKLSKKDIFKIKIEEYVQKVVYPNEPLSLRVSGHLLLGIVRILRVKSRLLSERV